jgi:hypothetical protein
MYNTHFKSIQIETNKLKKYLTDFPKNVFDAIKVKLTYTMDSEVGKIKEELARIFQSLDQSPSNLNVYIDQVLHKCFIILIC